MKSMAKKKIGGFMCHSPAATAVCMTGPDSRAVVIPGRRSSSERNIITNCTANPTASSLPSGGTTTRYSKLVDYHNINKLNNNIDDNRRHNHHHHRHRDQSQAKLSGVGADNNNNNNNNGVIVKSEQREEQPANNNLTLISGVVSGANNNSDRQIVLRDDLNKSTASGIDSLPHNNVFQVVVMRVSLHCQGCAGKLKKYIAKMEGVTSFTIELEHKRVTVMGHVSPVVVLENISKVRRAEFWPSSASSTDHYLRHF